ncbi:peptidoglycan editing factor PgeF [Cupriavidus numazuensis]|uniref:Purine nucleoside phosphorylase n=1 Tax=Cupriavidus numazuensis TaxID=221992 RepID=A0ABM8TES5_9BURK|nr:peptidoglycan editing factor PgeF [Cupriavidus numazuensis]CAG2140630.1 Polyphenol oxidase [Cupriavidus numazuensis]
MTTDTAWLRPDWPAPASVRALSTTRAGGVSRGPYGLDGGAPGGLNLGTHVGDDPLLVAENRAKLAAHLPAMPLWLEQVHGCAVATVDHLAEPGVVPRADASVAMVPGQVCAIMTADCLPVLLCDTEGTVVGAAHAGWRGLCNGVIEAALARMQAARGKPSTRWLAWLGPAIGPGAFEVGAEVREAFLAQARAGEHAAVEAAFRPGAEGKYLADIYALARTRLARAGCTDIYGGDACTVSEPQRFYSYRRDGVTGRMASLVWLES